jgi:threonine synthase
MKNEAINPTGSFKDRMAAVAVSRALADGHDGLLVVSSGNMGSAVATYSARARLPATVVVSSNACPDRVAQFRLAGAKVVTLDGPDPVKMVAAAQLARSEGLLNVTAPFNPFAPEGVRTVGYEIWTEFGELPDWVVVPVGYGSLVTGLFGAFQDIVATGASRNMPRLAAVQSTGSPSLVRAFERGLEAATPGPADSVCSGINQEVTIASVQVLRALRASRGTAVAVPDADILAALELLAWTEGILVEPTGAAAIAGLSALRRDGVIGPGEVVVTVLTGTGIRGKTWGRRPEISGTE